VRAARVALYAATPDELPTRPLFEGLTATRTVRLLPRIRGNALEFAAVERWDELRPGRYGVLEPPADRPRVALGPGDAVVVPGVAFDASLPLTGRHPCWWVPATRSSFSRACPTTRGTGPWMRS
jgi:5-formyltetrahydrofolate cyclo-ligase